MRNKFLATATLICSALAVSASVPTFAQARDTQARDHHRVRVCRDVSTRGSRNTGTVVGAVTGGLLGNEIGRAHV